VLIEERKQTGEPLYLFPIFELEGEFFAVQGNITEVETAPVFHIAGDGCGISIAFNSLATMMLAIAESYETGVYQLSNKGNLEWDAEKFTHIRLKYNPGTTERLYVEGG
jgi:hypothetical protein